MNNEETPTTVEETTGPLVVNAIYNHWGRVMIATSDFELTMIVGVDKVTVLKDQEVEMLCEPGSQNWVDRMVAVRRTLVTDVNDARKNVQRLTSYQDRLGEAILEKAVYHDWCSEYDEFADEWDLPKRITKYDVTMTIQVDALNRDAAIEFVRDEFGLNEYSDNVMNGPNFEVEEA